MKRSYSSAFSIAFSIALVVFVCKGNFSQAQEEVDCVAPPPLARTNGAVWPRGANITVVINPTDFPSDEQQRAIQSAFVTWQNANQNSGVTFTFMTGTQPAPGSQINTYYVARGATTTGADTNIGYSGSPSTTGNTTQSAVTTIDPSITRLSTITNVMVHEIGHTFGLDDCLDCAQGSTIMSRYRNDCLCAFYPCDQTAPFNGIRWGCPPLEAPRLCEVQAVAERANYPPPPTPTPTPMPSPTPCAGENNSCTFARDCCPGLTCGELTGRCFPCELDPHGLKGGCVSEACANCYSQGGTYCDPDTNSCWTPILIDVKGDGIRMTGLANGVRFDGFGNGIRIQTAWTINDSDDAWLVLDRNGNSLIDNGTELFSSGAPQPVLPFPQLKNGFNALAQFDKPESGGNGDGLIDKNDLIFSSLRLWQDLNHNGISESSELHSLPALGLAVFSLEYREARRRDGYGNTYRYRSKITDESGSQLGKWAWDVFPLAQP